MKPKIVTNAFGLNVRICCASCAQKGFSKSDLLRHCALKNEEVRPCDVCEDWQMQAMLEKARMTHGRIKRKEYLLYLADLREEEQLKEQLGIEVTPLTIAQVRAAFEKKNGSIYINF